MTKKNKTLFLNIICFAFVFLAFRIGIGSLLPLPHLPLVVGSAVLASFITPKFLIKDKKIWVKYPWKKQPKEL